MSDIRKYENWGIRSLWDEAKEEWYFSVIDVVAVLTESNKPRDYWYRVKKGWGQMIKANCRQFVDS